MNSVKIKPLTAIIFFMLSASGTNGINSHIFIGIKCARMV